MGPRDGKGQIGVSRVVNDYSDPPAAGSGVFDRSERADPDGPPDGNAPDRRR